MQVHPGALTTQMAISISVQEQLFAPLTTVSAHLYLQPVTLQNHSNVLMAHAFQIQPPNAALRLKMSQESGVLIQILA